MKSRIKQSLKAQPKIKLPECLFNGKVIPAFYANIDSITDEYMLCQGNKVWYDFIYPNEDVWLKVDKAASPERIKGITIFIHLQFMLDEMTDSMVDYIVRDGGYKFMDEDEEKVVEIYSMACVNGVCQYSDYEEWGF